MAALDVISLEEAKDYLHVGDGEDDALIASLISAAIDWIEKYTDYYLYARDIVVYDAPSCYMISAYPINSVSAKNTQDETVDVIQKSRTLTTYISAGAGNTIKLNVGYENKADIPQVLLVAAKKIIIYLYENRDMYMVNIPVDIQFLLNQHRRSATI